MPAFNSPVRTGIAYLPLHHGKAPPWLFKRMVKLSREITIAIVDAYGPGVMLKRLSQPYWFQAFGCVLGFDWHSSGVTTTLCAALKEGIRGLEKDLGLFVAGGKGQTSRETPTEIQKWGEIIPLNPDPLIYASRMAAKVDTSAVQDGYALYHHSFIFTNMGAWAVVQQGMNETSRYARRYHWLSETVTDFVNEPHAAILSETTGQALNLVAEESNSARNIITEIATERRPEGLISDLKKLKTLELPRRHQIEVNDLHPDSIAKILLSTYERKPANFEKLLGLQGVGPKTIRALSLISEIIYGVAPSYRDPARYTFVLGGKDGIPFPVDRETYDESIELLSKAINKARLGNNEKQEIFGRLSKLNIQA